MRKPNLRNTKQLLAEDRGWDRNPHTGSEVTPASGCHIKTIQCFFLDPTVEHIFFLNFFFQRLFIFGTERAISPEPDAGLQLTDREFVTWLKSDA